MMTTELLERHDTLSPIAYFTLNLITGDALIDVERVLDAAPEPVNVTEGVFLAAGLAQFPEELVCDFVGCTHATTKLDRNNINKPLDLLSLWEIQQEYAAYNDVPSLSGLPWHASILLTLKAVTYCYPPHTGITFRCLGGVIPLEGSYEYWLNFYGIGLSRYGAKLMG